MSDDPAADKVATKTHHDKTKKKKKHKKKSKREGEKIRTFEELKLNSVLVEACHSIGWTKPSGIQRKAIPYAIQGRDIIGLAKTGSGKTAAFCLPVLHQLLQRPQARFALMITPTRELAVQIQEQLAALGAGIGLKTALIIGGVDMMEQAISLTNDPHIIVGTPGRLADHLKNTKGFNLSQLRVLVLDEADRLFSMEFEAELDEIMSVTPRNRQTLLFSATMTSKVQKLQRASLTNPVRVSVSKKYDTVNTLKEQYVFVPVKHKDIYLAYMLSVFSSGQKDDKGEKGVLASMTKAHTQRSKGAAETKEETDKGFSMKTKTSSVIVFVSTCQSAMRLALMCESLGMAILPLHGQMPQQQRLASLNQFRAGRKTILVATDVASRGLDIPHVDVVLNYDIPTNSKDYIHRVGRTARAGRSGRAVTIVSQYDVEIFQRIEHLIGHKMDLFDVPKQEVLRMADSVQNAQRLAHMMLKEFEESRKHKRGRSGKGSGMSKAVKRRKKK